MEIFKRSGREKTVIDFATLFVKLDNTSFIKNLDVTVNKVTSVSKKIKRAGVIISALAIPLGLFAKGSVNALATFDDEMSNSLAIMGDVSKEMRKELEKTALVLSTKLPVSANEAARSYNYLAAAGLDAKNSLAALPVVSRFATAGAFDMATATDLLTDAQSALGLTVKDSTQNMLNMTYLSDMFVKGNTLANTSVQQLSEAITNDAGAAIQNFNLDLENAVGVLAAYADRGIKGNIAGSMFGRMLRLLSGKAIENKAAFKAAGISVFTASGAFRDFGLIAKDLENRFGSMSVAERVAEMTHLGFSALVQKSILPLIGMSDQINEYTQGLKNAGDMTQEVVDKKIKGLGIQFKLIGNQVKALSINLASRFEPEIRKMQQFISLLISKFNNLSPATQKVIGFLILLAVALGPVLIGISFIVPALTMGVVMLGKFAAGFIPVLGTILVAITLFKIFKGAFTALMEKTAEFRDGVVELIKQALEPLIGKMGDLNLSWKDIGYFIQATGYYLEAFGAIGLETFIFLGTAIYNFIKTGIDNLGTWFDWICENWRAVWDNAWDLLVAWGKDILNFFKNVGKQIWSLIQGDGFDFGSIMEDMGVELDKALRKAGVSELELIDPIDGIKDAAKVFGKNFDNILSKTQKQIDDLAESSVKVNVDGLADKIKAAVEIELPPGLGEVPKDITQGQPQQDLESALERGSMEAYKAEKTAELQNRNLKANEVTAKNSTTSNTLLTSILAGGERKEKVVI